MHVYRRAWVLLALLPACQSGVIGDPPSETRTTTPPGTTPPPGQDPPDTPETCDTARYQGMTLDQIAQSYADHVHPLLLDAADGCTACHAAASGRQLVVTTDAMMTFYRARSAGLLEDKAGTILDRVRSTDERIRMPRGLPAWSVKKQNAVLELVCALKAHDAEAAEADETFPPDLLSPYPGTPVVYYDNTFVNYRQLRGKVTAIFGDDWVRGGVDQWSTNLGLFGGVDFQTRFIEARNATSDFLLALDTLAKDVCGRAAHQGSGPFAGLDLSRDLTDVPAARTTTLHAADSAQLTPSTGQLEGDIYDLYTNGTLTTTEPFTFPTTGDYRITVRARGSIAGGAGPDMEVRAGSVVVDTYPNLGPTFQLYTFTGRIQAGTVPVAVAFTNDLVDNQGNDRNLFIDYLEIEGPLGAGTGNANEAGTRRTIDALYGKMLYRSALPAEQDDAYALLQDLVALQLEKADAWSGLCEALVQHPDFLFTLPPSRASVAQAEKAKLLLVKVAQDLVARPPTDAELARFAGGATIDQMIDGYLSSTELRDYLFYKMRIRTESDGSPESDEPARLWTLALTQGEPFQHLLTGDFGVDENFQKVPRPAVHGQTGVLTMKGYLQHKPGLPHFNYPARVLSDFMGYIFEVPPEVVAQRITATAASTVDPQSICFNCHKLLTPLAHQRLAWEDDGTYREVGDDGQPIDDTDRNLVADYPYKGKGLESFSTKAVKKERFIRHTFQALFTHLYGRPMRYDQDERDLYHRVWELASNNGGDLRAVLKAMMAQPSYRGE